MNLLGHTIHNIMVGKRVDLTQLSELEKATLLEMKDLLNQSPQQLAIWLSEEGKGSEGWPYYIKLPDLV